MMPMLWHNFTKITIIVVPIVNYDKNLMNQTRFHKFGYAMQMRSILCVISLHCGPNVS